MELRVNGSSRDVPLEWQGDSLLMVLREALGLVGAKFGCGQAQCGACTVWLDGTPTRSCVLPVVAAAGRAVLTVQGLARGERLHPVQQAWLELQVPQCGYCQAGHLCRCGTQQRIRAAVHRAAQLLAERGQP